MAPLRRLLSPVGLYRGPLVALPWFKFNLIRGIAVYRSTQHGCGMSLLSLKLALIRGIRYALRHVVNYSELGS